MNIPRPPNWLMAAIALAALMAVVVHEARGGTPAYYAGRPPPFGVHKPYKCWCKYHGPHGGCVRWECPKRT